MLKDSKLLLALDLGNTSTSYGLFEGKVLLASGHIKDNTIPFILQLVSKSGVYKPIKKVIISSVVPKNATKLIYALKSHLGPQSVYLVGQNVKPRVRMKYSSKQLGSDRLVNLYGAVRKYSLPILVIDFGTAITFDYVSKSGVFEGGLIVPGVESSFQGLLDRTALLPKELEIKSLKTFIGKDTKTALVSGLLNGFGSLADGLVDRFRKKYGRKMKVLITGGFAGRLEPYMRHVDYLDSLHTIRSLALIYQNEIEKTSRKK